MSISSKLQTILDKNQVRYSRVSHVPTYGAQFAAAVMHAPGKEVAKTVVLRSGKRRLLAVLPAPYHVDLQRLAAIVGGPVTVMEEKECDKLFPDCEHGAVPPFGELYGLPVYMDKALEEDLEILVNAGTRSDAIRMSSADFIRIVKPNVCSFATKS